MLRSLARLKAGNRRLWMLLRAGADAAGPPPPEVMAWLPYSRCKGRLLQSRESQ